MKYQLLILLALALGCNSSSAASTVHTPIKAEISPITTEQVSFGQVQTRYNANLLREYLVNDTEQDHNIDYISATIKTNSKLLSACSINLKLGGQDSSRISSVPINKQFTIKVDRSIKARSKLFAYLSVATDVFLNNRDIWIELNKIRINGKDFNFPPRTINKIRMNPGGRNNALVYTFKAIPLSFPPQNFPIIAEFIRSNTTSPQFLLDYDTVIKTGFRNRGPGNTRINGVLRLEGLTLRNKKLVWVVADQLPFKGATAPQYFKFCFVRGQRLSNFIAFKVTLETKGHKKGDTIYGDRHNIGFSSGYHTQALIGPQRFY